MTDLEAKPDAFLKDRLQYIEQQLRDDRNRNYTDEAVEFRSNVPDNIFTAIFACLGDIGWWKRTHKDKKLEEEMAQIQNILLQRAATTAGRAPKTTTAGRAPKTTLHFL